MRQIRNVNGTAILTASIASGSTVTVSSVNSCMGIVKVQNSTGGNIGTSAYPGFTVTVNNTAITANSIVLISAAQNANSASGVQYQAQEDLTARVAGVSFALQCHRVVPSGSAAFIANEELLINYLIIN